MEGVQNMVIVAYCWQHTETTLTAKPHHSSTRTMVRLFFDGQYQLNPSGKGVSSYVFYLEICRKTLIRLAYSREMCIFANEDY